MEPAGSRVDIWLARQSRFGDPERLEGLLRGLPDDERERVARMALAGPRHEQLITRALARHALSAYLPEIAPAQWRFERSELGRPSVAADMPAAARLLHFNIAHTPGLVVMAVGRMPALGIDVEQMASRVTMEVARRYFSAREVAALEALDEPERIRRMQRLWTLKESYLKAIGSGLAGGLDRVTFDFDAAGVRFEHADDADAARWQFREITVDEEYLVALACLDRDSTAPVEITWRDFSGQE